VYEALHELGGVLSYGIPSFRLPKDIVRAEVEALEGAGVVFTTDVLIGAGAGVRSLMDEDGFDAVFVGTGAGLPRFAGIDGEDLIGVLSANEFLTRVNLMHANELGARTPVSNVEGMPVVVIGGGNTALDAARTAVRLGAGTVTMVYRRSRCEMPARAEEVEHAVEEGVVMRFLEAPIRFEGEQGWLASVTTQRMRLGETDDTGRRRPEAIPGSTDQLDASVAIVAIGNAPNPILVQATEGLTATDRGAIVVDDHTGATSLPGVFAGGDITTGGATVILALAAGRRAASAIDRYLADCPASACVPM
jgi:glutamate synthase (NADPH/NADH) small chain